MDPKQVAAFDALVARLTQADWKGRDAVKAELLEFLKPLGLTPAVRERLDDARKGISLEVKWELDEIIEALTPPPVAPPPKEEEKEEPKKQLSAADLNVVYDDPRGIMLHKSKKGERYFLTQADQRTGAPRTIELTAAEVTQVKAQLKGSPYWLLGSGA
jgi:hypothetical protein